MIMLARIVSSYLTHPLLMQEFSIFSFFIKIASILFVWYLSGTSISLNSHWIVYPTLELQLLIQNHHFYVMFPYQQKMDDFSWSRLTSSHIMSLQYWNIWVYKFSRLFTLFHLLNLIKTNFSYLPLYLVA